MRFPQFLSIEPERLDDPPPKDISSFSSTFLCRSSSLQNDRQYFVSQLLSTIEKNATTPPIKQLAPLCLEDPDVDWKQLIFEAAYSKGLHKWMAERSWLLPGTIAWRDNPGMLDDVLGIRENEESRDLTAQRWRDLESEATKERNEGVGSPEGV